MPHADILQYMTTDDEFNAIWQAVQDGEYDTSDIHRAVAAKKLGIPSRLVTDKQRRAAKEANYIRLYSYGRSVSDIGDTMLRQSTAHDHIVRADYSALEKRIMIAMSEKKS